VAAVSKRPVFDIVRERLGSRVALVNLIASFFINLLTVTAEIAGVALVLELATNVNYLAWSPSRGDHGLVRHLEGEVLCDGEALWPPGLSAHRHRGRRLEARRLP
jgi:hypothetical protein